MGAKQILLVMLAMFPLGCAGSLPKDLRSWRKRDIQPYLSRYGFKGEIEGFNRLGDHLIFADDAPNGVWIVSKGDVAPRRFAVSKAPHGDSFFITPDGKAKCFVSWPATRALDQSATWYAADSGLGEYVSVFHGHQLALDVLRIDQPDRPVFTMNAVNGEYFLPSDMFSTQTRLYLFDDRSKEVIVLSKTAKGTYPIVDRFVVPGEFMEMSDDGQWILVWLRVDIPVDLRIGIYLFNVATHQSRFLGRQAGNAVAFLSNDFLSGRLRW